MRLQDRVRATPAPVEVRLRKLTASLQVPGTPYEARRQRDILLADAGASPGKSVSHKGEFNGERSGQISARLGDAVATVFRHLHVHAAALPAGRTGRGS